MDDEARHHEDKTHEDEKTTSEDKHAPAFITTERLNHAKFKSDRRGGRRDSDFSGVENTSLFTSQTSAWLLSEPLSEMQGTGADLFSELSIKVIAVGKTHVKGNLGDTPVRLPHQIAGVLDPEPD